MFQKHADWPTIILRVLPCSFPSKLHVKLKLPKPRQIQVLLEDPIQLHFSSAKTDLPGESFTECHPQQSIYLHFEFQIKTNLRNVEASQFGKSPVTEELGLKMIHSVDG